MLLSLSKEKRDALIDEVLVGENWERLETVLREDTLIVWPFVNREEGRLVLFQYGGSIMEVNVRLLELDVSDPKALQEFLDLINKKLPLKFKRKVIGNSLKKTLLWTYEKSKRLFPQDWQKIPSGNVI